MTEKMFPIMLLNSSGPRLSTVATVREGEYPYVVVCVPWAMLLEHEAQALRNHGQTIQRLAERGGLSAGEAVAVLQDRPWEKMTQLEANKILCGLMTSWYLKQAEVPA